METVNIHGKKHATYAAILDKAHQEGLVGIKTELDQPPIEYNRYMVIVKASATFKQKDGTLTVFEGLGDATPKNVNPMIAPHIVRMAETRAKGRALRDGLNIGEVMKEEMV